MTRSLFLKSSLLLAVIFTIFPATQSIVYGQLPYYFNLLNDTDYKWQLTQEWNADTEKWEDTLSLSHVLSDANGKPSEIVYYNKTRDNSSPAQLRVVKTYEGNRLRNSITYVPDTLDNDFQEVVYSSITYWYSGDFMVKTELVVNFSAYFKDYELYGNINFHIETGYRISNNKAISDSSFVKYSGVTEEAMGSSGLSFTPQDTVWQLQSRREYSYVGNSIITTNYDKSTNSSTFIATLKDSTIMDGDKISEIYTFVPNTDIDDDWEINESINLIYAGEHITQMITKKRVNDSLINSERTMFFLTPYPGSGIRAPESVHKTNKLNAFVSSNKGYDAINLSLSRVSDVCIYVTDLKGRKVGNVTRTKLSSGSNCVPLAASSMGKYLCHIITGQERTVVPFSKTK